MQKILPFLLLIFLISCKEENKSKPPNSASSPKGDTLQVEFAKGFSAVDYGTHKILKVSNPFPESDKTYTYLLTRSGEKPPKDIDYDERVNIPIEKIVVTSTTHIPSLESLEVENTLVGFPDLDYISSPKTRQRIEEDKIADLDQNENINLEVLLSLQPDAVIGFSMKENNKVYSNISNAGTPVIFNGDWNEENPMGKAEWIKFFGVMYDKEAEAEKHFETIKENYESAKALISQEVEEKPTVLSGAMYQDVWYLPGGKSWMAQFIADAGGNYLYKNTDETGSLSLSFESVFDKARDAEIWIAPSGFTSFEQMKEDSKHYTEFEAFKNKQLYGYTATKGETGGVLYFELAPNRPDLVLKDLIKIFHPELLADYENTFFKALE
ncbi:MAG TPA: ABC transporter substrate-binding protein [Flavobacteriaceae bacterium]|nr:ABC transporter substrate-binding protein [Flavobacteriaceae bacterium]